MIEFKNITKTYKVVKRQPGLKNAVKTFFKYEYEQIQALKDVSFTINDGEMVSYIGPNGAGKSTTIKIMCGILTPDSGICTVNGKIPYKERISHVKDIGVVFGQRSQLWWDVPVNDSFELLRQIYKIDYHTYNKNLNEISEILELKEILKTPARNLSLGQRMRCEIVGSLLHDPKVLFLDEPTIGLDAVSKISIRKFIKRLNEEKGTTVILTTHDMQDVEALTQRILLIGKGSILYDGNFNDLKKNFSNQKKITVEYRGIFPKLHQDMTIVEQKNNMFTISIESDKMTVSEAISYLVGKTEVTDLSVTDISTEEVVAELYREYHI